MSEGPYVFTMPILWFPEEEVSELLVRELVAFEYPDIHSWLHETPTDWEFQWYCNEVSEQRAKDRGRSRPSRVARIYIVFYIKADAALFRLFHPEVCSWG